ncbi:MAG: serine/threonine protein kinase [Planctomycetes bacterium]|nr:serine/threonine protein kinase [Planctomycetota bacterium]
MSDTLREFVRSLSSSGILTEGELRAFVRALPPNRDSLSPDQLARALVDQSRLTNFQAEAVQQGRPERLFLGDYLILEPIGAGGMGQVYKAEHRRMSRIVALKVLIAEAVNSERAVQRFYREVRTAARLEHRNIVTAYDAGEAGGNHYLVMQYIDGPNFKKRVDRRGPLTLEQAVDVVLQTAEGLAYAHEMGVIHRDIKPSNLLMTREGVVKILDMGLARLAAELEAMDGEAAGRLTMPGQVLGTADYMPPEQATDTHAADERSDCYSLGCTLYYLLTGRPPFPGDSMAEVLMGHAERPVPAVYLGDDDRAQILLEIMDLMLRKDPAERYQNMDQLIADLRLIHAGRPEWDQTDDVPHPPRRLPREKADSQMTDFNTDEATSFEPDRGRLDDEPLDE